MIGLVVQPGAIDGQVRNATVPASRSRTGSIEARINSAHRIIHRKGSGGRNFLTEERHVCTLIRTPTPVCRTSEQGDTSAKIGYQQRTAGIFEHVRIELF